MHPSHQIGATERQSPADRLTEWLLTYCPMSTLALLTLLVMGSTLGVSWPWPVLATAGAIDLALNLIRRRRVKRLTRLGAQQRASVG
jgi:Flp pilus assembly protein TadB